ncbi:exosome complex exonuclease rrp44 [Lasius niger]|uniref:Protein DIS3 homolog n=1 Tax=Lasius niger TaxID=67767 RepID=A0A0J7KXE0_LASNI|nr:exosome complex exonuclease rrp44 [Lasius niger]
MILAEEEDAGAKSSLIPLPYVLILDTNIILDQIDILEEDVITNVIILQTVLEEIRHKSSNVYKKLKNIIKDPKRKFFVFINEHHRETYIEREPGEKINDRNDRAIRVAVKWYNNHLSSDDYNVKVVLLTEDVENKTRAAEDGLFVLSMEDYIASLENSSFLLDKLCKRSYTLDTQGRELFPCHLTPVEVHDGVSSGKLLQGTFLASRENFLEGNVNVEGREKPIFVQGRTNLNRAVDGDIVAVELLPDDQWSSPSEIVLQDEENTDDVDDVSEDEKVLAKPSLTKERIPTGKIVGIIRRKWRQYCGILQPSPIKENVRHLFVPAERKIPKIRIETRQAEILSKQRIIVALDSWPRNSKYPLGHFVRALGNIGDKETENEVLLLEHDVPHSHFSDAVLSFLPKLPWVITEVDIAQREDLRHLDICSVDPPGCTDIDDALHCRSLPNGNFDVGVHIADVSHFIRPGTALDKEAASRATTVYLVDKRIDMVPELLSSNLCSLRGEEERFAFSCIWEIDPNANIINTRFCKSIICSRQAMTYEEAQLKIDDATQQDAIAQSLRGLNRLAKQLKKKRLENGALTLASPEIRFQVDSETHDPIDVEAKKLRETNSMVEEFMLLANISVAEKILEEFPECAMLRRHPEPPQSNFEPLIKAAKNQLFFRGKVQDEEGYILFVRKNALQVLIPKYGLEGTLYLSNPTSSNSITFTYNSEDQSQTCGSVIFRTFDPIVVQMSLDRSNVQHEKLIFKLVKPEIPDFSVSPLNRETVSVTEENSMKETLKRKAEIQQESVIIHDKKAGKKKKKKKN